MNNKKLREFDSEVFDSIEAEFIMYLLLCYVKAMEIREDYYEKLVSNKEKYKEDNKRKENN